MTHEKKYTPLLMIILFFAIVFGLALTAKAQDFYGEGNVLIAVDMAPYAENEDVDYPEGTMGTLKWGEDAPEGVSTRPAFSNHAYEVSQDVALPPAPDYNIAAEYHVDQTVFFPFVGDYIFSDEEMQWFSADALPPEVFDGNGESGFLINARHVKTENGVTQYKLPYGISEEGEVYPAVDFLEIECVAVTDYSTFWQYTGTAYSGRPDFDSADYIGAVELTEEDIRFVADACDEAYTVQERIYGDPRWEDQRGDCDGKAAYVMVDLSVVFEIARAFYCQTNTDLGGFDCLVISADSLPGESYASQSAKDQLAGVLAHELNHYIVSGCIGHEAERWNIWVGEAFAESAVYAARPESTAYIQWRYYITNDASRLRLIPGMVWDYDSYPESPFYDYIAYTLGPSFLRYIERETTGQVDGRLWSNYFAQRTPVGSITAVELDAYLKETTGEGLDDWMAQFMAAVVVGASDGLYCMGEETVTAAYRTDPYVFFRPYEEYGTGLSFDDAADEAVRDYFEMFNGLTGLQGGGTAYAWRNDSGGKIAVTGADDRWYFFAVNMELPDECGVIEIGSPEELAKIGNDPSCPLSGSYALTTDIDLGGDENEPWTPIGTENEPFTGEFDGNGHAVRGLYINDPNGGFLGLFGAIAGNGTIRELTVYGSVAGGESVGGIIGWMNGGAAFGCKSHVRVTGDMDVGGIAGALFFGTVENCTALGTVTGDNSVGGITGFSVYSDIRVCRNAGIVTGASRVGGVVGQFQDYSTLQNCYNSGQVVGGEHTGGVAGRVANSEAEDCYSYLLDLPAVGSVYVDETGDTTILTGCFARSDTNAGDGYLTTAAFSNPASFPGWDFENVWTLEYGVRPVLRNNPETIYVDDGGDDTPVTPIAPVVTPPKEEINVAEKFDDVSEDDWYYDAVDWAVNEGLMNGVSDDTFDPNGTGTRAMVVTMLWRLAGEPETGKSGFEDIAADSWYELAVNWAAETGAVLGTSEETFSPDEPITREQLAVILYRYAQSQGLGFTGDWAFRLDYSDAGDISDYAYEAMCWMTMHGIIEGMGDGTVAPQAEATRAQIATIFMRFYEEISK